VGLAALGVLIPGRTRTVLITLAGLAALVSAGIGTLHVGVEQGWWPGPTTCVAPDIANVSPEELLERILAAPVVRCDDVAWSFLGVSMAGWNGIACLVLAALWLRAYASSSASQ
jgi:disulfide bond formation protein DsbB